VSSALTPASPDALGRAPFDALLRAASGAFVPAPRGTSVANR
jgi:hypothetical protein